MQPDHVDQLAAAAKKAVAIEVSDVSKAFALTHDRSGTVKDWVVQRASRNRTGHDESSRNIHALRPVTFEVMQGETFGILGHNGSGKSTLLKIMAGVIRPSTGRVRARGTISALLELGAGFHPDLTGRENIYLNASILGFSKEYVNDIFDKIVQFSEIGDFLDMQVKFYSSGMRARLGFSVATNLEPDILLVDEVLAVGDERFRAKCMERVHRFRKMNHTMVIVSHGPERVRELCDRAAVLDHGQLLFVGDSDEAIDVYRGALYSSNSDEQVKSTDLGKQKSEGLASSGTRRFTLSNAEVVESMRPNGVFKPGDDVGFVVDYQSDTDREIHLSVAIKGRNGDVVIRQSTAQIASGPITARQGRHQVRLTLHDLPLLDDVYSFTFVAREASTRTELDRIGRGPEFTVKGPGARLGRVHAIISLDQDGPAGHSNPQTPADVDLAETEPQPATSA